MRLVIRFVPTGTEWVVEPGLTILDIRYLPEGGGYTTGGYSVLMTDDPDRIPLEIVR